MRIAVHLVLASSFAAACISAPSDRSTDDTTSPPPAASTGLDPGNTGVVGPTTGTVTAGASTAVATSSTTGGADASSDGPPRPPSFDLGGVPDVPLPPPFVPCPSGCPSGEYCEYCPRQAFACGPLPERCLAKPTCECVQDLGSSCEASPGGTLYVQYCISPPPP
ncbi:MAG: hypothetical protein K0V04_03810 [Deltaproteobacteria bacterium]|nr:hypothetical protein [Deltaproteobacteria bacterium]